MAVERLRVGASLIDVLDRVLDKGIVVDAWARFSLAGIDVIAAEARVVVTSIDTYIRYLDPVSLMASATRPMLTLADTPESAGAARTTPRERPLRRRPRPN